MDGKNITYRQQNNFCNKPGCRKCREGVGHGPYWYAYHVANGRTVRKYVGKALPEGVQQNQIVVATPPLPSSRPTQTPRWSKSSLRLLTSGQLRLESSTENLGWRSIPEEQWRAGRLLLAFLICQPERKASEREVIEQLWPDLDEKSALQQLRHASKALDQVLGPIYYKRSLHILSLAEQNRFWNDSQAFEVILKQVEALPASEKGARISLLEQALKLYYGELLPDERGLEWVDKRRQALYSQWFKAMLELAELYLAQDEQSSGAMDLLNQLISTEPTNEQVVQKLMFALARQHRRVEAVQVYQQLESRLPAAPSEATRSLLRAIQQGDEALFKPLTTYASQNEPRQESYLRSADLHPTQEISPPEISIGRNNQSPLIGRDQEVRSLQRLLEEVELQTGDQSLYAERQDLFSDRNSQPRAHAAVLLGEAGIGKTRLAEEAAREAQRRGWTVIWSHAYSQEQGIPYRLWSAAVRSILTYMPELARRALELAPLATIQPLRALIPEIQEILADVSKNSGEEIAGYEALSPEQEELRLRDAVYTFLTKLSQIAPLLVVLDDIQWSDESSAQMLGYFTRRIAGYPIALLGTCRESELVANRVLHGLISHMQREQVIEVIHVHPLSDEQIGTLVGDLPASVITHIQSTAEGNPFFAEELAYTLRSSHTPDIQLQALPGSITAVLNQRLNQLSRKCRELLGKAAVLGGSFNHDLISTMETGRSNDDDDTMLDLLQEALDSGVLAEEGSGRYVTYRFWHPLLASHLYNGLTATRRTILHRRIAEILHQIHNAHESEAAATITEHLIKGGGNPAQIAQYAELAGNHAYGLMGYTEAERYYRVALNHLSPGLLEQSTENRQAPVLKSGTTLEQQLNLAFLMDRLADCTRLRGNFQDTRAFYTLALQLRTMTPRTFASPAEERQEAEIQAMHWNEIAWILRYTGDTTGARSYNARGRNVLRAAGIDDGPAWGSLLLQQASLYWQEGYYEEALQAGQQALALFKTCLARNSQNGVPATSIAANRQTRFTRTVQGDPVDLGRTEGFLGIMYNALGQLDEALKHLQQALTIHNQYDRRHEGANVEVNIGHIYLSKGEYELARPHFDYALRYAERSGDMMVKSVTLNNLGQLAASTGKYEQAESFYRQALAMVTQMNDREYLSQWHSILGELLQEQKRFKEAAAAIRRALAIARAMSNQPCISVALVALANLRISLVENESERSSPRCQRALKHANRDLERAFRLHALDAEQRTRARLVQARTSNLLGEYRSAYEQARQACHDAEVFTFKPLQIRCQQLLSILVKG